MEFTVIYSKSLVTELFTEVCESNEGLYFHSQHQTNRIEACDIAPCTAINGSYNSMHVVESIDYCSFIKYLFSIFFF